MSTPSSDLLRTLFDAALDLPPSERAAWLQTHCPDPALRAQVLALLDADAHTGDSLHHDWAGRIAHGLSTAQDEAPLPPPDGRIGPFRTVRVIGEGGFSTVFEAQRDIEGVTQRVALKLLHCGLHTADARRRFEHERRALLQLKHPHITRLIDAGVSDTGQPWIALELVEGVPITDYARTHRLDLSRRLALFTDVCHAVDAAHRALIVHRDIKPSNVLVAADGTVSLLDFGIAKLLDDPDESRTLAPAFTPAYAAPEQQAGGPVTTATDVYALGILLDELITGERRAPGETRTPSARVTDTTQPDALPAPPRAMRKLLRGDLDNIVLKAIAEEPERRYASASALVEDIQRHLAHQPVLAHPPSKWYRTRKFIARHRGGVTMTAAFLLAIFAALGLALWQGRQAQLEATRANEVQVFLESLFQPLNDGVQIARTPTLPELLERGRQQVEERQVKDPQVRAQLLGMFLRIHQKLGQTRDIEALADSALDTAMHAWGERDPRTLEIRYRHATRLRQIGETDRSGEAFEALLHDLRAQRIGGTLYASTLDEYVGVRMRQGIAPSESIAMMREALRVRESDPEVTPASLALGHHNLSVVYSQAGDFASSLLHGEKALELEMRQFGPGARVANVLTSIASDHSYLGHWREAEKSLREARAMFATTHVGQGTNLGSLLTRLCATQADLELFEAAAATCDEAVAHALAFGGESHTSYAYALARRAQAKFRAGDVAGMEADIALAYRVADQVQGAEHRGSVRNIVDGVASRLWETRGEWARRRDVLADTLNPSAPGGRLGDKAPGAPSLAANLALACHYAPDATDCGGDPMGRADALIARPQPERSVQRLTAQLPLAELELLLDRPAHAIERLEPALRAIEPELPPTHSLLARAYALLAEARHRLGDTEAAQRAAAHANDILTTLPPQHPARTWSAPVRRAQ